MNRLLDNRYRILHSLAEGGFGATFLAEDTRTPSQRRCVVKQLKPIATNSELQEIVRQRFTREAAVLEELGHDHLQIPLLYAYFEEYREYYLVQEYVQGETLTQSIDRQGFWTEEQARQLLKQLLPVLVYIHDRGIIHRDIKPDNIILRRQNGIPALIDFGAVKEAMNHTAVAHNAAPKSIVIGTAGFMAPEQAVGRPMFSSDLYALGLTVIYCLTGKLPQALDTHPTTGEINWRAHTPHISAGLTELLTKAIMPGPHARFSTAQVMISALEALPPIPTTIAPESSAVPSGNPRRQNPENSPPDVEVAPTLVASPGIAQSSYQTAAATTAAPVRSVPQQSSPQKRKLPVWIVLAWLVAAVSTSGIVFAVMSRSWWPNLLNPTPTAPTVTALTPDIAAGTVTQFYQHLSNRSWTAAESLAAESLAAQFDPKFFEQFQRISVDNLRYLSKSEQRVELVGRNIYYYPDGATQEEERTFQVDLLNGQPRITASDFRKVLKPKK